MSVEGNRALIRQYYSWDAVRFKQEDGMKYYDDLHDPNYKAHSVIGDANLAQARQANLAMNAGFPDWKFTLEDMIAEDDKVVVRYQLTGTHQGVFWGIPPTGKKIALNGISIYKVAGGKLVESWGVYDRLNLMQQMGAIPPTGKK